MTFFFLFVPNDWWLDVTRFDPGKDTLEATEGVYGKRVLYPCVPFVSAFTSISASRNDNILKTSLLSGKA